MCATRDIENTHNFTSKVWFCYLSNIANLCKPSCLTSYIYKFPGRIDHILKLLLSITSPHSSGCMCMLWPCRLVTRPRGPDITHRRNIRRHPGISWQDPGHMAWCSHWQQLHPRSLISPGHDLFRFYQPQALEVLEALCGLKLRVSGPCTRY